MTGLTVKQRALLEYIREYMRQEGYSPSYEDMAAAMGLKSKSGIHRLVHGLKQRGAIQIWPHRSRSISIVGEVNLSRVEVLENTLSMFNWSPTTKGEIKRKLEYARLEAENVST